MRMHQNFKECTCGETMFEITPLYVFGKTDEVKDTFSTEELRRKYNNKQVYQYKLKCNSCSKVVLFKS